MPVYAWRRQQIGRSRPAYPPDITGIEIRLSEWAFIIENKKTPKVLFFPDSKIYLIVTVVSDQGDVVQTLT